VAEGAMAVAVEPDLGRNDRYRRRLAFGAGHVCTSTKKLRITEKTTRKQKVSKSTVIFRELVFQQLLCRIEQIAETIVAPVK
jgi:hypothetical protein